MPRTTEPLTIPHCKYPTTVLLVDDNIAFLNNLKLHLSHHLNYQLHHQPKQLLINLVQKLMRSQEPSDEFLQPCADTDETPSMSVNFSSIYKKILDEHKIHEISILIIDYAMPSINGIDFCKQLKHSPIKKVILTGKADHRIAVNAFNQGIIDKFILKTDPDVLALLNDSIMELEEIYFYEKSKLYLKNLQKFGNGQLNNPSIQVLIHKFILTIPAVEYYLLDNNGSYLFFDEKHKPSILIIKTREDIKNYYDIAYDNEADNALLTALAEFKAFPLLLTEADYQLPVIHWRNRLLPATPFCDGAYFYNYVTDNRWMKSFVSVARTPY